MVALSFNGTFRIWEKTITNTCYKFFAFTSFALPPTSCFNLHFPFRLFCQTPTIEMPSLNRNEKVTCNNFGTQTTELNLARHKKGCSAGKMYCSQCPNFSTKSETNLNYYIAKKHSSRKLDVTIP